MDYFNDALASGNVLHIRVAMTNSLRENPTFDDFAVMEREAASVEGLYDDHDGKAFVENQSQWNEAYLDKMMLKLLSNFSRERINHVKKVVRFLRPIVNGEKIPLSGKMPENHWKNTSYDFADFVCEQVNTLAYQLARELASWPAGHGLIYLYGGHGKGKTHLLRATAEEAKRRDNDRRVKYLTAEQYTDETIRGLRNNHMLELNREYAELDIMILDDIQFLAHKESVQDILCHRIQILLDHGKTVLLAGDLPPGQYTYMEDRFAYLLKTSIPVEIGPLSAAGQMQLLEKWAEKHRVSSDNYDEMKDIIRYIVESSEDGDVRIIQRKLEQVLEFSRLLERPLSLELAKRASEKIDNLLK